MHWAIARPFIYIMLIQMHILQNSAIGIQTILQSHKYSFCWLALHAQANLLQWIFTLTFAS